MPPDITAGLLSLAGSSPGVTVSGKPATGPPGTDLSVTDTLSSSLFASLLAQSAKPTTVPAASKQSTPLAGTVTRESGPQQTSLLSISPMPQTLSPLTAIKLTDPKQIADPKKTITLKQLISGSLKTMDTASDLSSLPTKKLKEKTSELPLPKASDDTPGASLQTAVQITNQLPNQPQDPSLLAALPAMPPIVMPAMPPVVMSAVQSVVMPAVQSVVAPAVQSVVAPAVQSVVMPAAQTFVVPGLQPSITPAKLSPETTGKASMPSVSVAPVPGLQVTQKLTPIQALPVSSEEDKTVSSARLPLPRLFSLSTPLTASPVVQPELLFARKDALQAGSVTPSAAVPQPGVVVPEAGIPIAGPKQDKQSASPASDVLVKSLAIGRPLPELVSSPVLPVYTLQTGGVQLETMTHVTVTTGSVVKPAAASMPAGTAQALTEQSQSAEGVMPASIPQTPKPPAAVIPETDAPNKPRISSTPAPLEGRRPAAETVTLVASSDPVVRITAATAMTEPEAAPTAVSRIPMAAASKVILDSAPVVPEPVLPAASTSGLSSDQSASSAAQAVPAAKTDQFDTKLLPNALKSTGSNADNITRLPVGTTLTAAPKLAVSTGVLDPVFSTLAKQNKAREGSDLLDVSGNTAQPAAQSPAVAVEAAPAESKPLTAAERAEVVSQTAAGVGAMPLKAKAGAAEQMSLQLHPKDWGSLHISVSIVPGTEPGAAKTVTAHIVAETPQIKTALQTQTGALHQALRASGLHLEHLTVSVKPAELKTAEVKPAAQSAGAGMSSGQGQSSANSQAQASHSSANASNAGAGSSSTASFTGGSQNGRQGQPAPTFASAFEPEQEEQTRRDAPVRPTWGRIDTHA